MVQAPDCSKYDNTPSAKSLYFCSWVLACPVVNPCLAGVLALAALQSSLAFAWSHEPCWLAKADPNSLLLQSAAEQTPAIGHSRNASGLAYTWAKWRT